MVCRRRLSFSSGRRVFAVDRWWARRQLCGEGQKAQAVRLGCRQARQAGQVAPAPPSLWEIPPRCVRSVKPSLPTHRPSNGGDDVPLVLRLTMFTESRYGHIHEQLYACPSGCPRPGGRCPNRCFSVLGMLGKAMCGEGCGRGEGGRGSVRAGSSLAQRVCQAGTMAW